jgi:hypothetical protein
MHDIDFLTLYYLKYTKAIQTTIQTKSPTMAASNFSRVHVVPSDALDTATIISSAVQVDTRVVGVVLPRSKNITGADAAVGALSAVEVPRS